MGHSETLVPRHTREQQGGVGQTFPLPLRKPEAPPEPGTGAPRGLRREVPSGDVIVLQSACQLGLCRPYARSRVRSKVNESAKQYLLTESSQLESRKMKCRVFTKDLRKRLLFPVTPSLLISIIATHSAKLIDLLLFICLKKENIPFS